MKHKLDVTINELRLKSIRKIVKRINTWSDEVKSYSDDALKQKTIEFKERLASGVDTLDTLLPEAYAVAREASWRVLGMYPKEVQLIGAIVLHEGNNVSSVSTPDAKRSLNSIVFCFNASSEYDLTSSLHVLMRFTIFLIDFSLNSFIVTSKLYVTFNESSTIFRLLRCIETEWWGSK
ncbi:protein translocase subunit secA 2 [Staphylococcus aureus M1348]|nr:protein translocase subunit secA 2 [Staphylococcus aureus M1348]